eukprot:13929665-Alexandrium_andersonii.AAC.1
MLRAGSSLDAVRAARRRRRAERRFRVQSAAHSAAAAIACGCRVAATAGRVTVSRTSAPPPLADRQ